MTTRFTRRDVLAGSSALGLASTAGLPRDVRAQARTSVTVRIDRELANFDPGYRTGPWDGNVIRSVYQRLVKQKPNSAELEMDAAAEVNQTSPTTLEFRLKPGQAFTDGFGAMTAEDVKFSFERIGLPPGEGRTPSPYRGDWVNLDKVEVTGELTGRIVLKAPAPTSSTSRSPTCRAASSRRRLLKRAAQAMPPSPWVRARTSSRPTSASAAPR